MDEINIKAALDAVKLAALVILENGGETYRAEETVRRMCCALGFVEVEVVALPTGIFITVSSEEGASITAVKRVKKRGVDLTKLEIVNQISRLVEKGNLTAREAIAQLVPLTQLQRISMWGPIVCAGLSAGFFTLTFGGSIVDFAISVICGCNAQLIIALFNREDFFRVVSALIGGIVTAALALLFTTLCGAGDIDKIISGAIMPLLPGLAMNNAIRDTMHGDLVSGLARGAEALIRSVLLATGAGIIIKIWLVLGGG